MKGLGVLEGLLVAALGLGLAGYGLGLPVLGGWSSWPGMSFAGIGLVLAALGASMGWQGLRYHKGQGPGAGAGPLRTGELGPVGMTLLAGLLLGRLPFELVAAGYLAAMWGAFSSGRRIRAAVAAAVVAVAISVALQGLFSVTPPGGSLMAAWMARRAGP